MNFGKNINQSGWYAADYCDVVFDGKIDMRDISLVCSQFMKQVNYMNESIDGVELEFRNGENHVFPLDSRGCIAIPQGATAFSVYMLHCKDGTYTYNFGVGIELFSVTNCSGVADAAGKFRASFVSTEFGNYLVRVGLPASFYVNLANETRSWPVVIEDNLVETVNVYAIRCPVSMYLTSDPVEPELNQPFSLIVTATNALTGEPVRDLVVWFKNKDGVSIGTNTTDPNGTASCLYSTGLPMIHNFTVYSNETTTYQNASAKLTLDLRLASFMTVWDSSGVVEVREFESVNMNALVDNVLWLRLCAVYMPDYNTAGTECSVYIDGVYQGLGLMTEEIGTGFYNGSLYWICGGLYSWRPPSNGTYVFNLVYAGDVNTKPCNFTFLAVAVESSYKIYFEVPSSFEAGSYVTMRAWLVYADTNVTVESSAHIHLHFLRNDSLVGDIWYNVDGHVEGWLNYTHQYPSDGHVYTLTVQAFIDQTSLKSMTMPVQFEVYTNTKLLWQVGYDNVTSEHVFTGELLMLNGTAVQNQDIKIFLNETLVTTLRTNETGFVEYRRHFDAGDETITYNVQATFEGTDAHTATLNATSFDGENYTVCTVTYFSFKPSANMTTVTVEPHATEVVVPVESPEEMQKYAIDLGWLKVWGEFGWAYPFFRTHAKLSLSLYGLDLGVHIGLNPILPDEGVVEWSDDLAELFASLQQEALNQMFIEVGGLIAMYFSAKGLSLLGRVAQPWLIAAAAAIMIAKFSLQGVLLGRDWNDKMGVLASGTVNTILAILVYFKIDVLFLFIESVAIGMSLSAASALRVIGQKIGSMMSTIGTAFSILRDWIDITEFVGDMTLAALSWMRFFQL
jgi:hypothetical protein